MKDFGLLVLRLTAGGLLAGHGAQKLFGWFGGHGFGGTSGWMESMGLQPGERWALAAGMGEFGGGVLTALGFMNPVGPLSLLAPMGVATGKMHWGKPIWVTEGGAELPVTNIAIGLALAFIGPGRFSMDRMFGIRLPAFLVALVAAAVAGGTVMALTQEQEPAPRAEMQNDTAQSEAQAGAAA